MSAVASRTPVLRVVVAVLVVGFGTLGLWGGLLSTPSAEPTVQAFLLYWQERDYKLAAGLTTGGQATVTAELRDAYRGLDAAAFYLYMGPIAQHGNTAQASFNASVDLGQNGAPWSYQGSMRLRRTGGSGWKIVWSPSVINPHLRPGLRLAVVSTTPQRSGLLDSSGAPLQTLSTAYIVRVRPGSLADAAVTARDLGRVTGLDPGQVLGWIRAAPPRRYLELVTLSPSQYGALRFALRKVPGLGISRVKLRLFDSIAPAVVGSVETETSPVLRNQGIAYRPGATVGVSGLQQARQLQLAGTPTTEVVTQMAAGQQVQVLHRWPGQPSRALRTTLDRATQRAADAAVNSAAGSAAIVAVQASTGHILAVAEHAVPGLPGIDPLDGRYPPGGAFTLVSTEGLLASGLSVDGVVRCPTKAYVGGQPFTDAPPQPRLGAQPPFWQAFASSCMTAFSILSQRAQTASHLAAAASGFGLGAHWRLPLPAFAGSVPVNGGVSGLAAALVGEGGVQMSPLAMAMVAAEVDTGIRQAPSLVAGTDGPARARPLSSGDLASLQALTRDAVRSGAAAQADLPRQHVHGQVGSVVLGPVAKGVWAHWFVGYRGGLAFAVLEFSHSATASAVPLGREFLASAPAG